MPNADASLATVRFVEEKTAGTTPPTPTMQEFRVTGETLNSTRNFISSQELRGDRQIPDLIATSEDNEGSLPFELSHGTHDDFLEGALQGNWSAPIAIDASDISVNGSVDGGTYASVGNDFIPGMPASLIDRKQKVLVATTANGTLSTAFADGQTIDGIVLVTGDRLLLQDQTTGANNGIYIVQASGAPVRAVDADSNTEVNSGMYVAVSVGTANGGKGFRLTTADPIVVGTTSLTFVESGNMSVGQWVRIEGFSDGGNNGVFRVDTIETDGSEFTVDKKRGVDTFTTVTDTAGDSVTMKGRVVYNGTTRHPFTIEIDQADVNRLKQFTGMEATEFSLTTASESQVTGAFNFLGRSFTDAGASLATATIDTTTTSVFNSVSDVGQIREGDTIYSDGFTEFAFTLNNNPRAQRQIGSFDLVGIGMGTSEVTGTASAYFTGTADSQALITKFRASTSSSFDVGFVDAAGNELLFVFPNIKYGNINATAEAINTDVLLEIEWQALRDAISDSTIQIHSIPA